jgi:outer membrane protein assembly factor BamB
VRRVPILIVAVLVATVLFAAALKWHAQRSVRSAAVVSPAAASAAPDDPQPSGLGAGPPPQLEDASSVEVRPGARMLHEDRRHTHRAGGRVPLSLPAVIWSTDVGGPVEAQVTTSPDEQTLYAASLGGTLTALSSADGATSWTVDLGDRVYATPCVADDGTIYVGSDAQRLFAISPGGKVKWSLQAEGEADSGPVISPDGTLVFAAGRMVYGLTPLGYVKWRFAAKRKVFTAPAVDERSHVFFGSQDHHAYGLKGEGQPMWSTDLGADVDGAPAIADDGSVYVGTDGDEVVRLDPQDGHVVWRSKVGGYVRGTLAIARNGDILGGAYGPTPHAMRLRADDGAIRGIFPIQGTGAREFGVHGGALEDPSGALLFGAQDDAVYAIDATGKLLWRFASDGDVDAPLTLLSDGTVVVGSDDGRVRALRAGAAP